MTKDEYNQMRKERSKRDKRLRERFPLGPFWVHDYIDMHLPLEKYKKEVKTRQNSRS